MGCVAWVTNWMDSGDIYYAGKDEGKDRFYTARWRSRRLLDTGCCESGQRPVLEI